MKPTMFEGWERGQKSLVAGKRRRRSRIGRRSMIVLRRLPPLLLIRAATFGKSCPSGPWDGTTVTGTAYAWPDTLEGAVPRDAVMTRVAVTDPGAAIRGDEG